MHNGMYKYLLIIKGCYLEYVRSYNFLIVTIFTIFLAFSFLPGPDANYSTLSFGGYQGVYNSIWIGYISAIMSSIFISLFGYFLIMGGIQKDVDCGVGPLIAATPISNTEYLSCKFLANFFTLMTILIIVLVTSIVMFYNFESSYSLELMNFIIPYIIITIPTLLFISILAVFLEVFLENKKIVQYIVFILFFLGMLFYSPNTKKTYYLDFFGTHYITDQMENQVNLISGSPENILSIGFVKGGRKEEKTLIFKKIPFPITVIYNRLILTVLCISFLMLSTFFFLRFRKPMNQNEKQNSSDSSNLNNEKSSSFKFTSHIKETRYSYNILPLILSELKMISRQGSHFVNGITLIGMIASMFAPIEIVYQFMIPILLVCHINRLSDLTVKDRLLRTDCFTLTSFKPTQRLFFSRLLVGLLICFFSLLPIIIRLLFDVNFIAVLLLLNGVVLLNLVAAILGTITRSQKFFEVFFIFLTYANLNNVSFSDYYGATDQSYRYLVIMLGISLTLLFLLLILKKLENVVIPKQIFR